MSDNGFLTTQQKKDMIRWLKRSLADEKKGIDSPIFFTKHSTSCSRNGTEEKFFLIFEKDNYFVNFRLHTSYDNFIQLTQTLLSYVKEKQEFYSKLKDVL